MFDKNSLLVKTWVRLVEGNTYTREQVPNLSNLRMVVWEILDDKEVTA
jgi:hypothetical protein